MAGSHAPQLPIAIGGGAVALLIAVGLMAYCMRKTNKESGADNVQPVELGSESHKHQIDVAAGVESRLGLEPSADKNTHLPATGQAGAGYGNLDDADTTYVVRQVAAERGSVPVLPSRTRAVSAPNVVH